MTSRNLASRLLLALAAAGTLLAAMPAANAGVEDDPIVIHIGDRPFVVNVGMSVTVPCAASAGVSTTSSFPSGIYAAVTVGACEFHSICDQSTGYARVDCSGVSVVAPTCDVRMDGQCLTLGGAGLFAHETGPIHARYYDSVYGDNSGSITVFFVRIPS